MQHDLQRHPTDAIRWARRLRGQGAGLGRRLAFDVLGRVTPTLSVKTDGLRLHVSTSDRVVSRETFARGAYERPQFERVLHELRTAGLGSALDGRGFLDIGANIGSATCLALRHYGAGKAWSFEPAPENLRLLRRNVIANGFAEQAQVLAVALSDHDGDVTFELSPAIWGDHRVRVGGTFPDHSSELFDEARRHTIAVPARRLDSLVDAHKIDAGAIGLAWIDVQGHEAHVLAGASALLSAPVPIVCEYWPYALERAGGLERFHALVESSRAEFIDLADPLARPIAVARLRELPARYTGHASTNLLVLA